MAKQQTRTKSEYMRGKKSVFAWIDAGLKDWLDSETDRQRRTLADTLAIILEDARDRKSIETEEEVKA